MQYKLQYQRDILLSMTQNCAKLHVTHNFLIPFIFISIYDLDLHLYFYDNFQFFLVSLFPWLMIKMLNNSTHSNFFALILALSLMMICAYSLHDYYVLFFII
jgi:hypothetical protein